jgi:hypothetical protein
VRCVVPLILVLSLSTPASLAQSDPEQLLAKPRLLSRTVKPSFQSMTGEGVREAIRLTSSRIAASAGFNTPMLLLSLPRAANSHYAAVEIADPTLVDDEGAPVAAAIEKGYDGSISWYCRLGSPNATRPVEYEKASGTIRVAYPTEIRTLVARESDARSLEDAGVVIDGPFVRVLEEGRSIAAAAGTTPYGGPVRAYDAEGRAIMRAAHAGSEDTARGTTRVVAFHGKVASVEVDVVESVAVIEIAYELPSPPKLAGTGGGIAASAASTESAGGTVTKTIVER